MEDLFGLQHLSQGLHHVQGVSCLHAQAAAAGQSTHYEAHGQHCDQTTPASSSCHSEQEHDRQQTAGSRQQAAGSRQQAATHKMYSSVFMGAV
jgi:hypothetical protein